MKKKKQNNQLSRLIKEWDQKLRDSGFNDIEDRSKDTLKSWAGTCYLQLNKNGEFKVQPKTKHGYTSLVHKESQAEYYRLAAQCLHEAEFKNTKQRLIWQLHAEGYSYNEIAKELGLNFRKVRYVVDCLAKEFGLKIVTTKQE